MNAEDVRRLKELEVESAHHRGYLELGVGYSR